MKQPLHTYSPKSYIYSLLELNITKLLGSHKLDSLHATYDKAVEGDKLDLLGGASSATTHPEFVSHVC